MKRASSHTSVNYQIAYSTYAGCKITHAFYGLHYDIKLYSRFLIDFPKTQEIILFKSSLSSIN